MIVLWDSNLPSLVQKENQGGGHRASELEVLRGWRADKHGASMEDGTQDRDWEALSFSVVKGTDMGMSG
jgi:hypothetical protein